MGRGRKITTETPRHRNTVAGNKKNCEMDSAKPQAVGVEVGDVVRGERFGVRGGLCGGL